MRHVHLQLPLTIKEKLYVTEKLNFAGMYKGFFRGVLFNKEIDQTKVQLSRGKIELSEFTLRIWIFFNFLFELPSDSFSFFQFFLQRLRPRKGLLFLLPSSVVGLKKIDSRNDSNRKSLCEEGGGCLFFGRFRPILQK